VKNMKNGMSLGAEYEGLQSLGAEYEGCSVKVHILKNGMSRCRICRMECQGVEYKGWNVNWCRILRM